MEKREGGMKGSKMKEENKERTMAAGQAYIFLLGHAGEKVADRIWALEICKGFILSFSNYK